MIDKAMHITVLPILKKDIFTFLPKGSQTYQELNRINRQYAYKWNIGGFNPHPILPPALLRSSYNIKPLGPHLQHQATIHQLFIGKLALENCKFLERSVQMPCDMFEPASSLSSTDSVVGGKSSTHTEKLPF